MKAKQKNGDDETAEMKRMVIGVPSIAIAIPIIHTKKAILVNSEPKEMDWFSKMDLKGILL